MTTLAAPSVGRFLTSDPAQAGSNWYAYCDNNPLVRVDPTGLVPPTLGYGSALYGLWGCVRKVVAIAKEGAPGGVYLPEGGGVIPLTPIEAPPIAYAFPDVGIILAGSSGVYYGYHMSKQINHDHPGLCNLIGRLIAKHARWLE